MTVAVVVVAMVTQWKFGGGCGDNENNRNMMVKDVVKTAEMSGGSNLTLLTNILDSTLSHLPRNALTREQPLPVHH